MSLAQWIEDMRWAMNMKRARAFRRALPPASREVFDDSIRHMFQSDDMAYAVSMTNPEAFYRTTTNDVLRAMIVSKVMEMAK